MFNMEMGFIYDNPTEPEELRMIDTTHQYWSLRKIARLLKTVFVAAEDNRRYFNTGMIPGLQ